MLTGIIAATILSGTSCVTAQPATTPAPATPPPRTAPDVRGETAPRSWVTSSDGLLTTRATWPVGTPLYVKVYLKLRGTENGKLVLNAELPEAQPIVEHLGSGCLVTPDHTWTDSTHLAGTSVVATSGVPFKFTVSGAAGGAPLQGETTLPVRIHGSIADILTGVRSPQIDQALAKELGACFYARGWASRGTPRLWLGTYTNCEGAPYATHPGICHVLKEHPDITLAIRAEVLHDGATVATARAWWRGDERGVNPYEGMLAVEQSAPNNLAGLDPRDGKWRLRIVSDPEMALRDFLSTRYWLGDVTVPLRVTPSSNWDELNKE